MKCKQVQELAGAYLYGDLAPQEMRAVRMHAQQCHTCREDFRTRGAVAASIPNNAPELTEEERQRIMWSVKGAIKAGKPARSVFGFRFSPAYALAAAVVVVVVGIKVVGSLPHTHESAPRATVRITEEYGPSPTKNTNVTVKNNDGDITKTPERRRIRLDVPNMLNRRLPLGVTSRDQQDKRPVIAPPEPPAPVVETPQTPDVRIENDDTMLPNPNESDNAETTPSKPDSTAGNDEATNNSKP
ncbi:MAG: zf-HC2 domain-containing protein [Armatimonadetes bacterium]|nr:zf-HC2 domain-containing protein [Armatimonadota bacterium]